MCFLIDFPWEAAATLATGVLAVAAAAVVGLRQVRISADQTAILRKQVDLEELKIRAELFERRATIYNAVNAALLEITMGSAPPNNDQMRDLARAVLNSAFLLPADMEAEIERLDRLIRDFNREHRRIQRLREKDEDTAEESQRLDELEDQVLAEFNGLRKLFERDLRLSL